MTINKYFNLSNVQTISDEKVCCDEQVIEGGATLYVGHLNQYTDTTLEGNDSSVTGLYSASSKAGTRYKVILSGTPQTGEVLLDLGRGILLSPISATYYTTYLGYGLINYFDSTIHFDFSDYLLETGTAYTLITRKFNSFKKFNYVEIEVIGKNPTSAATLSFSNGVDTQNVVVATSGSNQIFELSSPLKITTSQTLTVSTANGYNLARFRIKLSDI